MKKYIIILAALAALTSCEKYLEVKLYDQATIDGVFSKSETTLRYLRHLYSFIPEDESIDNREGWVVSRSDEAQNSAMQYVDYLRFRSGNYSSATTTEQSGFLTWSKFYQGINQCTLFISKVDLDKEDSPERITYMKAQARFLRAYYYYCLLRQYGPVYIWMDADGNPIQPDEGILAETIDRHTLDQNINFIVRELDEAAKDLPVTIKNSNLVDSENTWYGTATKGAALAVKSRVTLMAASPLYNGCELYKGKMKNIRDEYIFPQEADPSKWDAAADAAFEVIKLAQEGVYSLVKNVEYPKNSSFADTPLQHGAYDYEQIFHTKWNDEVIWGWWKRESSEYSYLWGAGQILALTLPPARSLHWHGFAHISPSLKLVDAFPMWSTGRYPVLGYEKDAEGRLDYSKPIIDPESGYQPDGWTDNYKVPVNAPWAGSFKAHSSTVGRDPRYYACFVPNGFPWPNENKKDMFTCYNNAACTSPWGADSDHNRVGIVWRKWYETNQNLDENDNYHIREVYPSIRLAEIYLNYAEALNEKTARDGATACDYIDLVRGRVGLKPIRESYPGIDANQELLRWVIRMERMCELNGEAVRHYDAVRWMIATEEYTTKNWTLKMSATDYESSWERVSDDFVGDDPTFTDRDYLFPIYSGHLAEMTNLTQNYGF